MTKFCLCTPLLITSAGCGEAAGSGGGDTDGSGGVSISDALYILHAALGYHACDPSVCNVDNHFDTITASDALRLLRVVVGLSLELHCPEG